MAGCWSGSRAASLPTSNDSHSIFLAVAKGPGAGPGPGYLSWCIVYEFNDDGKPVFIAGLPQMVQWGQCSPRKDGVIWQVPA